MQLLGLIFSKDNGVWNDIEILSALLTIAVCNDSKIFNSLLSFVNYLPVIKVDPLILHEQVQACMFAYVRSDDIRMRFSFLSNDQMIFRFANIIPWAMSARDFVKL
jgi:hypothetical protein